MFKTINKIIFFFKCSYSLFKFIFFKGLIGKELTYYQPEKSSNRNISTLNDEFVLINQADNSIAIVPDKNKCKEKIESLNESQFEQTKNEMQSIIETNKLPNDDVPIKLKNIDIITEKSIFDLESKDWEFLYDEVMKYITSSLENTEL
ncbi:uncharacterized protein LOC113558092 [Rhopalosiphum maidis]|uniref:uncharacterized protein LOC113558092 n=1 Tax=Rhopalosiphum maidis TaxID=43146 RepID=UPI000EFF7E10|nr:uncharacterized protein LOC113558092 [Rhopalosiphum maidis]